MTRGGVFAGASPSTISSPGGSRSGSYRRTTPRPSWSPTVLAGHCSSISLAFPLRTSRPNWTGCETRIPGCGRLASWWPTACRTSRSCISTATCSCGGPCPPGSPARRCWPRVIEDAFARAGLSLPAEWRWSRSHSARTSREANCGILGGTNVGFIRHYAQLALDIVLNPRHSAAWAAIADTGRLNWTVEQFLLSACLGFHRFDPESPYRGIHAQYLFPSVSAAFDPAESARLGFTHLLGPAAKQDGQITARLEDRIRREDAKFYQRCARIARSATGGGPCHGQPTK